MTLKSDAKGFLIADTATDIEGLTEGIDGIREDTSAILALLKKDSARHTLLQRAKVASGPARTRAALPARPAPARDPVTGRFIAQTATAETTLGLPATAALTPDTAVPATPQAPASSRSTRGSPANALPALTAAVDALTRAQTTQAATTQRAQAARTARGDGPATDRARDSRGRFGAGDPADRSIMERFKDGLRSMFPSALASADMAKVDPIIEATSEMAGMAETVSNTVSGTYRAVANVGKLGRAVIGRGTPTLRDKNIPWFRRMFAELRGMRRENRDFSRAEIRAIDRSGGDAGEEGGGLLSTILSTLLGPVGIALAAGAAAAWVLLTDQGKKAWESMTAWFKDAFSPVINAWQSVADWFAKKFPGFGEQKAPPSKATPSPQNMDPTGYRTDKSTQLRRDKLQQEYDAIKNDPAKAAYAKTKKAELEALDREIAANKTGARGRAVFDMVPGGADLAKNGTYTPAEAERIRQLKSSGANTSAQVKGGMPKQVQEKIIAQAKASGLDPAMMLKIAAIESGGNANAISSTGAIGVFQHTGKTATSVGIKDRFNEDQNIAGGMELTKRNIEYLRKKKLPVTTESVYMMHQLGASAASEVLAAAKEPGRAITSLSPATQAAVAKNYGSGVKTAAEYVQKNATALGARADTVIGKSETGYLPTSGPGAPALAATPAGLRPAAPAAVTATVASNGESATRMPAPAALPVMVSAAPPPKAPAIRVPSVTIPAAPAVPPTADAAIPIPINSKTLQQVILADTALASQDVRDRRLAAIATGGLSSS